MSGKIVHFDISGPDEQALGTFYRDTFGWRIQHHPDMEYSLVTTADGALGGGIGRAATATPPIVYIEVDRIEDALVTIAAKGGAKVSDPVSIPGMVRFATFTDPAGNVMGLVEAEVPPAK